ncbi:MAG: TonB-dependent receptor, partial [Caldimonas sp.]
MASCKAQSPFPKSAGSRPSGAPRLLPLGALAAGFGLFNVSALAQLPSPPSAPASAPDAAPAKDGAVLKPISVKARAETDQNSVRATTSSVGKGVQDLRDIPQSVTIVTEKLIEDRKIDTLKEALHQTAGITFQAAEGGEEDIRLRGFSLAASGDIYVDGVRDPAFYERDTFSFDRIELLRGSASMLFGRGSTGGVVNQVNKRPVLADVSEVTATAGSGSYLRGTGDFNLKLGETSALRINTMLTNADNYGNKIDKYGIAPTLRWGIGSADEFTLGAYYLNNHNGINYGIPWLRVNASSSNPSGLTDVDPKNYYGAASDYNAGSAQYLTFDHVHRFAGGARLHTIVRNGYYDRDQRASTIRYCVRTVNAQTGVVNNPDCPSVPPTQSTIDGSTLLTRGTNNKVQNLHTTYVQSDYSESFDGFGLRHEVLGGVDLAHETFQGFNVSALPPGVVLDKNSPRATLGNPNDGTWVDESLRIRRLAADFDAKALGIYAQDLLQIAPHWKLLGGLRWDRFEGRYRSYATAASATAPVLGAETANRSRTDS